MTTTSVVIATCDERADLEATVSLLISAKVVPDEIIVVDDGSREPVEPRLEGFRRYGAIRVLRNERRTGSGRAKSQGLDAATSDLLVVMDSHMRPPWQWLEWTVAAFEQWPESVMCPWSVGFRHHPPGSKVSFGHFSPTFADYGARFIPHKHGFWDIIWNKTVRPNEPSRRPEPAHGDRIGCVLGGCYIFGRALMHRLGGYNRHHVNWGYEQEWVSLRAWIAGHDCRILDFPMPHHYTAEDHGQMWLNAVDSPSIPWGVWANRHFAMACAWHDRSLYRGVYFPLMREHYWPAGLCGWHQSEETKASIETMRDHIASIRKRSDDEVAALLEFPHPRSVQDYRAYEAIHGRKKK